MTILEELIDAALSICQNSRSAGLRSSARGAIVLTDNGKTYQGCDVQIPGNEAHGVSAERAAVLAAVADGSSKFEASLHNVRFLD